MWIAHLSPVVALFTLQPYESSIKSSGPSPAKQGLKQPRPSKAAALRRDHEDLHKFQRSCFNPEWLRACQLLFRQHQTPSLIPVVLKAAAPRSCTLLR
ncbi:hypothetical protein HZ326_0754 [Fusarium oxysporum f. sp. albedinis]|nr:hypothetical protein HZ326_0754 [Fusarium oxysporum f. sp. albedinis]